MSDSESTICYLIRHGATVNNEQNPPVLQGQRVDLELSVAGRDQAARTGRFLAARTIDAVYSSPMRRARQTAEAIASPHGLSVEIVEDIIEVDVGEWEGMNWDDIRRADPTAYEAFMTDAGSHGYLGGECLREVMDRAAPALDALLRDNVGRRVVVVAHNVVNRGYLTQLLGMPLARYRSVPQDNCGLNVLRCRQGTIKAVTVNSVFHLE